jgi:putative SOS response-associated peptidase YedK
VWSIHVGYRFRETDEPISPTGIPFDLKLRYNIAPDQPIPVILADSGRRRIGQLRWGLVPSWAWDEKIGYKMINGRAETLQEKPAFRRLV